MAYLPSPAAILAALSPRRLVFVGGRNLLPALAPLREQGFAGEVAIVSSRHETLGGFACVPRVADVPFAPDMAFVGVGRANAEEVVRALAGRGCKAAIVHAGGYAETGAAGRDAQRALVAAAGSMVVFGPNAPGFVNVLDGVPVFMDRLGGAARTERGVAIVSQGGGFLCDVAFADRSLPLAYLVGLGNQAQVTAAETIAALAEDSRVSAIGVALEGLPDGARLAAATWSALVKGIPVVVLKGGRTTTGALASATHTASITGDDALWSALFRRQNVVAVASIAEMLETLKLFHVCGRLAGSRLFVGSGSGIQGIIAADTLVDLGFDLPQPSDRVKCAVRRLLPDIATPANPQDVTMAAWGKSEVERDIYRTLLDDPYDAAILINNHPPDGMWGIADFDRSVDAFLAARQGAATPSVILSTLPEGLPRSVRERAMANGAAPLQGMTEAAASLRNVRDWTLRRAARLDDPKGRAGLLAAPVPAGGMRRLSEWEAKELLRAGGFPVPAGRRVQLAEVAAEAFPVALKLDAPGLAHKAEIGAVRLGIGSQADLEAAAAEMAARVAIACPELPASTFIVEAMAPDTVAELLVSFRRDAQMGWAMVLGEGGSLVELRRDCAVLLLPATRTDIEVALSELQIDRILHGWRNSPPGDRAAFIDLVEALAAFVAGSDGLVELELNPIIVREAGKGAVIVDALATLV